VKQLEGAIKSVGQERGCGGVGAQPRQAKRAIKRGKIQPAYPDFTRCGWALLP
jgi:hypothetical protein